MTTIAQLESMLTNKRNPNAKKIANNTWLNKHEDGSFAIRFHQTDIVIFYPDGSLKLNTGGYPTRTTRERMQDWCPVDIGGNLGYDWGTKYSRYASYEPGSIHWHLTHKAPGTPYRGGPPVPFEDGITLIPLKQGKNKGNWQATTSDGHRLIRPWTEEERWENYLARTAILSKIDVGLYELKYGTEKISVCKYGSDKVWRISLLTLDGFDELTTCRTLTEARGLVYRYNAWASASSEFDRRTDKNAPKNWDLI